MIKELKTYVWQCGICRELSAPMMGFKEPETPPAGWIRTLERCCPGDNRCLQTEYVDLCPECLAKMEKDEIDS